MKGHGHNKMIQILGKAKEMAALGCRCAKEYGKKKISSRNKTCLTDYVIQGSYSCCYRSLHCLSCIVGGRASIDNTVLMVVLDH